MKCTLLSFLSFVLLFSSVLSLEIFVSPEVIANSPTLVAWTRSDADGDNEMKFDLRFVRNGTDVGLAEANIVLGGDEGSGHGNIAFPSNSSFELVAVTGNTNIGKSNKVSVISSLSTTPSMTTSASSASMTAVTTSSSSSALTSVSHSGSVTSTVVPTSTTETSAEPTPSPRAHPNLPALVGGILGTLLGLALIALFIIFLHRRRVAARKRLTFHRDMMVQRRLSRAPSIPALGAIAHPRPSETFAEDVEHGLPSPSGAQTQDGDANRGSEEDMNKDEEAAIASSEEHHPPFSAPLGTGHIVPPPKGPRTPCARRADALFTQRSQCSPRGSPRPSRANSPLPRSATLPLPPRTPTPTTAAEALAVAFARTPTLAVPLTVRQKELNSRLGMLRRQMADLQLELETVTMRTPISAVSRVSGPSGRAAEIRAALEDMARQMVWLREQEGSPWAMHDTDVKPAGWARYMRP